jgi:hypothetical protein
MSLAVLDKLDNNKKRHRKSFNVSSPRNNKLNSDSYYNNNSSITYNHSFTNNNINININNIPKKHQINNSFTTPSLIQSKTAKHFNQINPIQTTTTPQIIQKNNSFITTSPLPIPSTNSKKQSIQSYLSSFEQAKTIAAQRAAKYESEMKVREQKILNSILKAREKKEKELDLMEHDLSEKKRKQLEYNRLKELEKIRERNQKNNEKLTYLKNHLNDRPANENEYLFKVLENEYKTREENEIKLNILKHKEKLKEGNVTLTEIAEFTKKQKANEIQRLLEIEEERKKLKSQWKNIKQTLPKFEASVMQKVKEEERKIREDKEKEENKKRIKLQEIKNYSEIVSKMFTPKIDEHVRKQREDRIKNLITKNNIPKQYKTKKQNRIILVKPNPSKPKRYTWETKLNLPNNNNNNNNNHGLNDVRCSRSKSAKHKLRPLDKPPDYLTQMRIQKDNNKTNTRVSNSSCGIRKQTQWNKMINNNKNTLIENVEQIKQKAHKIEQNAKMKEQLMHANGDVNNIQMQSTVSNLLLDAIKAKLTILENI